MKYGIVFLLILGVAAFSAKPAQPAGKELKDSLSYAVGMDVAGSLKELNIDLPTFYRGLEDVMKGKTTLLTKEQADEVKRASFLRINEEQSSKAKKKALLSWNRTRRTKTWW